MSMRAVRKERRALEAKKVLRSMRADYLLYAMLIPGLLYFLLFHYMPMYGVSIAFRQACTPPSGPLSG